LEDPVHHRALLVVCLAFAAGCAASHKTMASARMEPAPAAAQPNQPPPPPLERSVFARDPHGALTEDGLQKILAAPIELELPSRVGVMPIVTATDWRGPGPDDGVPAGLAPFVSELRRDPAFSLVTQTMVIPSGSLGMEALRENAARYRLRYVLLYREVLGRRESLGSWAWGYATVVGALFLPGQKQEVYGYIEASMFDVKTGLLMFTTRRSIVASQRTNVWHQDTKLDKLASAATGKFAPDLATDVLADLRRFAGAAQAENEHRLGHAADPMVTVPTPTGASVATDSH
jgi:hypothetical protein